MTWLTFYDHNWIPQRYKWRGLSRTYFFWYSWDNDETNNGVFLKWGTSNSLAICHSLWVNYGFWLPGYPQLTSIRVWQPKLNCLFNRWQKQGFHHLSMAIWVWLYHSTFSKKWLTSFRPLTRLSLNEPLNGKCLNPNFFVVSAWSWNPSLCCFSQHLFASYLIGWLKPSM